MYHIIFNRDNTIYFSNDLVWTTDKNKAYTGSMNAVRAMAGYWIRASIGNENMKYIQYIPSNTI